jgi:hypothetical protein
MSALNFKQVASPNYRAWQEAVIFMQAGGTRERWIAAFDSAASNSREGHQANVGNDQVPVTNAGKLLGVEGQAEGAGNGQFRRADDTKPIQDEGHHCRAVNGQIDDANVLNPIASGAAIRPMPETARQPLPPAREPSRAHIESELRVAKSLVYGEYAEMAYVDLKRRSKLDKAILNWLGYVPPERQGESIPQLIAADKFKDIKVRAERANEE